MQPHIKIHTLRETYTQTFPQTLSAANGAGQNVVRASLAGALTGALNGYKAIPPRFVDGLESSQTALSMAQEAASLARDPDNSKL